MKRWMMVLALAGGMALVGCSDDEDEPLPPLMMDGALHDLADADAEAPGDLGLDAPGLPDWQRPDSPPPPEDVASPDAPELVPLPAVCPGEEAPGESEGYPFFDLGAGALPFPSDLFTEEDPTTVTGRRLALSEEANSPYIDQGLAFPGSLAEGVSWMNELDGFGTFAPLIIPLSKAVDPATLPDRQGTRDGGASVFLVGVDEGSPAYRSLTEVSVEAVSLKDGEGEVPLLQIFPVVPLYPATRYSLVVTRAAATAEGEGLVPSPDMRMVLGLDPVPEEHPYRATLESLADRAEEALLALRTMDPAVCPEDLALVLTFTTQSIGEDVVSLMDRAHEEGPEAVEVNLDPDGDGAPDLYPPNDVPNRPRDLGDTSAVGLVLKGTFLSPRYLGADDTLSRDEAGAPEATAVNTLPFLLTLPMDPLGQPYPVVIVQHGHGADKETALYMANALAREGMAMMAIDLYGHGERAEGEEDIIDLDDLRRLRDRVIQQGADHFRLVQALGALSELDVVPHGQGDGLPDISFERLGYVGESLGGITGTLSTSLEPRIEAVVLNVSGGGLVILFSSYLDLMGPDYAFKVLQIKAFGQTVLERGDPINYAPLYRRWVRPSSGTSQVLVQEVIDDNTMPNGATEALARAIDVPQVGPAAREVEGLTQVGAPANRYGLTQFDPADHGFLLADPSHPEASEAAREQAAFFLRTQHWTWLGVIE